jgi:alkylation response protein AidB-like acyl-CoA dehydrogenase
VGLAVDLSLSATEAAFAAEARAWLAAALAAALAEDPVPTSFPSVAEELAWGQRWQARLAADRWVGIHWPVEVGGRGASPVEVALFNTEYARAGAPQPVNRVGINLAGPTLLAHGTDEQQARWLPSILDASELWCQLFSEPDAGSDLAALRTVAVRDESIPGWRLRGQKVWTSYAGFARWGICLARTDPDAQPRHAGISYLVVDMHQPGIDIRPLRQITGESEFNEVFLDGVVVPDDHLVGPEHGGWAVAGTTLAHERGTAFPFKEQVVHEQFVDDLWQEALAAGRLDDVLLTDALAQAWLEVRLLRLHNWRTLTRLAKGQVPGPESSLVKLAWTDATQHLSATALDVLGPAAPAEGRWARQWLWSKAASIAGGTSEVQKTILAERLLGLPR